MTSSLMVTGANTPSIIGSRQGSRERPRSGYRKISNTSDVDETLFGSQNIRQSLNSRQDVKSPFKPPTPKVKGHGPPLLWAPPVSNRRPEKYVRSPRSPNDSQKYRLRGHTPTFVDETLFGPKLEEPSFPAPWAERKKQPRPFNWGPPQTAEYSSSRQLTQTGSEKLEPYILDGRPPSRQGRRPGSTRTRPCTVESVASSTKSKWKP